MKLVPVAKVDCGSRACPTVYKADDDSLVVQGYIVPPELAESVPAGEARVLVPLELLRQAARRLFGRG